MTGVVEITTGRDCRFRWSVEEKLRLVAETVEPGVAIRGVAARPDSTWICAGHDARGAGSGERPIFPMSTRTQALVAVRRGGD